MKMYDKILFYFFNHRNFPKLPFYEKRNIFYMFTQIHIKYEKRKLGYNNFFFLSNSIFLANCRRIYIITKKFTKFGNILRAIFIFIIVIIFVQFIPLESKHFTACKITSPKWIFVFKELLFSSVHCIRF